LQLQLLAVAVAAVCANALACLTRSNVAAVHETWYKAVHRCLPKIEQYTMWPWLPLNFVSAIFFGLWWCRNHILPEDLEHFLNAKHAAEAFEMLDDDKDGHASLKDVRSAVCNIFK